MSLQIAKLVLYSRRGEIRELSFKVGALNVLTGASKTGKSAIIDIVDYCTGRAECNVADGIIRKYVGWYGILFDLDGANVFIARRNPDVGQKGSPDIYLERGTNLAIPAGAALFKNTTVASVEQFLGASIGISENENRPEIATRDPLEANFRHALLFAIQDQNDIDSRQRLFHRQGEDFISQAIKDTLPYFLGAVDEDRLLKQAQLDQAKRHLRQLERQLRESEAIDSDTYPRARALFDEAKQVGLVDERAVAITYETVLELLASVARDTGARNDIIVSDGEDVLAGLRSERQSLRGELERVNADIRSTRMFSSETSGYEREAKEQRARLSSVQLIKSDEADLAHCPLCQSELESMPPTVSQISRSLRDLSEQLSAVEAENPRLQLRLSSLLREEGAIEEKLRQNQQAIADRQRENVILQVQQDSFILQARTIGKIVQYVETASRGGSSSAFKATIDAARARVDALEKDIDAESVRERLDTFLNIIGRYMTQFSEGLDLEHRGSQLRLDIRSLTIVADTVDGPVPLTRMGSGENWVGYHVLAHLSLHKWFRQKKRPVPGFLIFDQPSQAHYPPDKDAEGSLDGLPNEDQTAVEQLFALIEKAANELAPDLQIIVLDHADLKADWFSAAVVERWRSHKLIPESWQDASV